MVLHRTLRRQLVGAFAVVFAGALFVVTLGVLLVVPRLAAGYAAAYVVVLALSVTAVFTVFGVQILRRLLLQPLVDLVSSVESISRGALDTRLPEPGTEELARLSAAVSHMAGRLIADQQKLADNIQSLNETNRLLMEARDAMILAEKMASVGRLGTGIAHEVGNPLGAILGYLALLGRRAEGQQRELVEAAEREARRIDRIVRGLLDYARPREAAVQPTDLNRVIRETIELVQTQGHFSGIGIDCELASEDVVVSGDPYQLQQVLVNLLVNAADALSGNSEPRIRLIALRRRTHVPLPHVPARRRGDPEGIDYSHRRRLAAPPRWPLGDPDADTGDVVELLVLDNGPGLPADMLEHVFEPFFTTKEPGKGTGLGLAVCARLVDGMGGAIHAGNADGGGAVFRVILPALQAEAVMA
jgi:two-component system, NtrC family, sensor kinase